MNKVLVWMLLGVGVFSCGTTTQTKQEELPSRFEGMDRRTKLRLQSYMANGQRLYNSHCANCHQKNGKGLRALIPSLRKPHYLRQKNEVACLIKHGATGPMKVAGQVYDAFMPANESLRSIQVAELMSYIGNVWGNREGLIPVKDVVRYLDSCQVQKKVAQ